MGKSDLSSIMAVALAIAEAHGGKLERLPGGFWTYPGCPRYAHNGNPHESYGTSTIAALVARGRMKYVEWKEGRNGRFPIAAEVVRS